MIQRRAHRPTRGEFVYPVSVWRGVAREQKYIMRRENHNGRAASDGLMVLVPTAALCRRRRSHRLAVIGRLPVASRSTSPLRRESVPAAGDPRQSIL